MPRLVVLQPTVIATFDPPRFVIEAWNDRWSKWERVGAESDETKARKMGRDWSNKHDVKTHVLDREPRDG